ncbi:MAG: hypothetical protein ACMXX8_00420 [Candidatus Woesearchaeota archaeon]
MKGEVKKIINSVKLLLKWYFQLFLNKITIYKCSIPKTNFSNIENIKKSDTIFIFGSGYSINDISKNEFKKICEHNTLSFNWFHNKEIIPIDYYIVREIVDDFNLNSKYSISRINKYFSNLKKNNLINSFLFVNINTDTFPYIIKNKFLKKRKFKLYENQFRPPYLTPKIKNNNKIFHGGATLNDAIHLAYQLNFKNIILVGVDLYDRRYFWLNENEIRKDTDLIRGAKYSDIHNTTNIIIKTIKEIKKQLKKEKVNLYVYNEKSLLNKILPVYNYKK